MVNETQRQVKDSVGVKRLIKAFLLLLSILQQRKDITPYERQQILLELEGNNE